MRPSDIQTNFTVNNAELKYIMKRINTKKAMSWSGIPRSVVDPDDGELVSSFRIILENILNTGEFPEMFNCTRLKVINK